MIYKQRVLFNNKREFSDIIHIIDHNTDTFDTVEYAIILLIPSQEMRSIL